MGVRDLAEKLSQAKSKAQEVLDNAPDEADVVTDLEGAIELLGRAETELDRVADNHGERA